MRPHLCLIVLALVLLSQALLSLKQVQGTEGQALLAQGTASIPPEAQTALERGLSAAKQGEWELAIKYLSQAQKAAPELPQILFNLALASAKAEGRDLLAIAWFRAYLAAAPKAPNAQQVRTQILDLEVRVEGTIGKLIRLAKDTAAQIPDDYSKSRAYSEIAKAQVEAGDIAGARETAAGITDDYSKSEAYSEIAKAQAKAGDIAGAKEAAAGITEDSSKFEAYSEIAQAQVKAGDIAGAKEAAAGITDDYSKSEAYSEIAKAQAKAGDIAGAKETAARVPDDSSKSEAYVEIAKVQAKVGDVTGASQSIALAKETTVPQAQYKVSTEIKSWTNLAITYQEKPLLADLGAFVESLKKEPSYTAPLQEEFMELLGEGKGSRIPKALAGAVRDLASALRELRDEEVKWQKLRAQATP